MAHSQWHRFYTSKVAAPPGLLFGLLSDMPHYDRWLPPSGQFARTTDVEPYPVQLGSRYHDGKPDQPGQDWWGTVTGFQRPGSIDFHHTIRVRQLRATVDVHIHYSFEQDRTDTVVNRWLILDFSMPIAFRPLRPVITAQFDKENLRTMAAVKQYAEAHASDGVASPPADRLPRTASPPLSQPGAKPGRDEGGDRWPAVDGRRGEWRSGDAERQHADRTGSYRADLGVALAKVGTAVFTGSLGSTSRPLVDHRPCRNR